MPDAKEIIGDWPFLEQIDATPSQRPLEPVAILSQTTEMLRQGEAIILRDVPEAWKNPPIFLDEQSLPFVLYISDQNWFYSTGVGYKYHFKWCRTLEHMEEIDRRQRYRAKYDICNPAFEINDGNDKRNLKVCLNCCDEFSKLYLFFDATKGNIMDKFRMPEFFEKFGKIDLPESTHPGGRDGYTAGWPEVSRRAKEKAGWRCQDCGKDFNHDRQRLDVHHNLQGHHITGVKSYNVSDNLEVVCRHCHAKKPGHGHMRS